MLLPWLPFAWHHTRSGGRACWNVYFASWSDKECYQDTGFNKCKLEQIFKCFGLQTIADQNDGYVRVSNYSVDSDGRACCYLFDPKEMFLYFIARMKKGPPHKDMCSLILGGSSKRWSPGWRWMLMYLSHHYKNIIGHQGLIHFLMTSQGFTMPYNKKLCKMIYVTTLMGPWLKYRV